MNTAQALSLIKNTLISRRWGGSGDPVFNRNSVRISPLPIEGVLTEDLTLPAAAIWPDAPTMDPVEGTQPDYWSQPIVVGVITQVSGDQFGTHALMGRTRQALVSSDAGLANLVSEAQEALKLLNGRDGFTIQLANMGAATIDIHDRGSHVQRQNLRYEAFVATDPVKGIPASLSLGQASL